MEEFAWKRYWRRPSDVVALTDEGYLVVPGEDPRLSRNPAALPFAEIAAKSCLALIGELGLGKSTELRRLAEEESARGGPVLSVSLGDYREEEAARREIFEDRRFNAWAQGDETLTIFLDGLDEGLVTNRRLAGQLAHQFAKHDRARLRLRITCRAEAWTREISEQLQRLWGSDAAVYELLPLRREDIALAARQGGVADADAFLDEVARRGLGPLAARPLTLRLLLNIARRGQAFPDSASEVFRRGCTLLCEGLRQESDEGW